MGVEATQLIQELHRSSIELVYVCAGAGTHALSSLFSVPGASQTVLESRVPYAAAATNRFLGKPPKKYVSAETAQLMAGRALTRAQLLHVRDKTLLGVACTGAIVTDEVKRGKHRAYIAVWSNQQITLDYIEMAKGKRTRPEEEQLVSAVVLNAIANAADLQRHIDLHLGEGDRHQRSVIDFEEAAARLETGGVAYFGIHDFGRIRYQDASPQVLLPGSFNPLHQGHLDLADAAASHLGKPIAFELSVQNVDKPRLAKETALARAAQFAGQYPIYLSNAPTFVEKSRIFGATTFVVGFDTAARIIMPKYYGGESEMKAALSEIQQRNSRFLVAPRADKTNQLQTLSELRIPQGYEKMFAELPGFRVDLSSTELRAVGDRGNR